MAHGEEGGGGGTPISNRLGDHTGRYFEGGIPLRAPAEGSTVKRGG